MLAIKERPKLFPIFYPLTDNIYYRLFVIITTEELLDRKVAAPV
jgi:hypothetical protein